MAMALSKRNPTRICLWRLFMIIYTLDSCVNNSNAEQILNGIVYHSRATLTRNESPYRVTNDIIVEREGNLRIEPGTVFRFDTGIGITVRGILSAEGNPSNRIQMVGSGIKATDEIKVPADIRLVDGPSIFAGRLQLKEEGRWFSMCTNSRNWTEHDIQVACKQLGFRGGQFLKWFDHDPDANQVLFENPLCQPPLVSSLTGCVGSHTKKFGSGVCDDHLDLGIQCDEQPYTNLNHWRGIQFEHANFTETRLRETNGNLRISSSSLSYVDIFHAGFNRTSNLTSAINVIGIPPRMQYLHVRGSASNAINITNAEGPVDIRHSTIAKNRGYGVFINSSSGMARIHNTLIADNGADGVRYVHHDALVEPIALVDFCAQITLPVPPNQIYPGRFYIKHQKDSKPLNCIKTFVVNGPPEVVLSVHFLYWFTDEDGGGSLEMRDGLDETSPLLFTYFIANGSRPHSITSTGPRMWMKFNSTKTAALSLTLEIESGFGKPYDLNVTDCRLERNNGRGIVIENLRSSLGVVGSEILNHNYVAGIHVVNGSGDVNITSTIIKNNNCDGVNISYAGGRQNITRATIENNQGRGIAIWFNESSLYKFDSQNTVIYSSNVLQNLDYGVLVGNFCGHSVINITQNTFAGGENIALKILSCWAEKSRLRMLHVTVNNFTQNRLSGLVLSPAVNLDAEISYNYFAKHELGALFIRNENIEELESLPATVHIFENNFENNKGYFVANLGLCQHGEKQELYFTHNYFSNNEVTNPFPVFNPRSRVSAVLTISSCNVIVYRNHFENLNSVYDIGSHVGEPCSINASHNYYSSTSGRIIYRRIFDSKYRYNIAEIKHHPYLTRRNDLDTDRYFSTQDTTPDEFERPNNILGGEVTGRTLLNETEYTVVSDIVIAKRGELKIPKGSKLKFARSVGILIHGTLNIIQGSHGKDNVVFTQEDYEQTVDSPVRLFGGETKFEGRLQVQLNGEWGTVCNYRWTVTNAALVCRQMGLVLNPENWLLEQSEMHAVGFGDILMSNVQCNELDVDFRQCRAETKGYFKNSCTHANDVGIRCYKQGWAGVRTSLTVERRDLRDILIEKAGLFDPDLNKLQPALQMELAHFNLYNVNTSHNIHAGMGVIFGNPFFESKIENSVIQANGGHGVLMRSQGLWLENCAVQDNEASGVHYNPAMTWDDGRNLVESIDLSDVNLKYVKNVKIIGTSMQDEKQHRDEEGQFYVATDKPNIKAQFKVFTDQPGDVFQILVVGAVHPKSTASLVIRDGLAAIDVKKHLLWFPNASLTNSLTIVYNSGAKPFGKIILHITPFEKRPLTPTNRIHNCDISRNDDGISVLHYNRAFGDLGERYLRTKNESIEIYRSKIHDNNKQALFIVTPHHEPLASELANITYVINETNIDSNDGGCILQISRDIRNSNNVFNWILGGNTLSGNRKNGVDVMFPYVWQSKNTEGHSFYMQNNTVIYNKYFKFVINGFYANIYIRENNFSDNACKNGLINLSGMEKLMVIERNFISNNTCRFMFESDINSHNDMSGDISAYFVNNWIQGNRFVSSLKTESSYQPNSYTVAVRGVQKVIINNNVLDYNLLEYELIAGVRTNSIDNFINVRENWWGTTREELIRDRIFDFDDWNSFARADFSYFLLEKSLTDANRNTETIRPPLINLNYLGGRMYNDTRLRWREDPYIIRADLTIMPKKTLFIDPGVQIQFYPSVGILVLGSLKASGRDYARISMTPYNQERNIYYSSSGRYRKAVGNPSQKQVRLCTRSPCEFAANQGFIEVYNSTTLQWTPLCDKRFTERNAEVVCQELGFQKMNVFVKFGPRLDVDPTYLSRIRTWPEPRQCTGNEKRYFDCDVRLNGDFRHVYSCPSTTDFVFAYCGKRNLPQNFHYWGGIRFANAQYEHKIGYTFDKIHDTIRIQDSVLEYVDIIGAGILHNEKSSALQAIFNAPRKLEYVNITNSASHGVNLISPNVGVNLLDSRIVDNLGVGVNILELNGYTGNRKDSEFSPLKTAHIPYNAFGLVDICESHKELEVEERLLVYYRYHNHPVDCVKIFRGSLGMNQQLGFRLLQFNFFNSTDDISPADFLRIFDGNVYGVSTELGKLTFTSNNTNEFFTTSQNGILSIQLSVSGATEDHGFIAEIVSLPSLRLGMDNWHNITYSVIENNRMGGSVYSSTGENNPYTSVIHNQFKDNGIGMFGNFTSCEAAVIFDLRNTKSIIVNNNLLMNNQGGLSVTNEATSGGSRLIAYITHNLITSNKNRTALAVSSDNRTISKAEINNNFITQNHADYEDTIVIKSIYCNFSQNYIRKNFGRHTLAVYGFEGLRPKNFQTSQYNSFYQNVARTPEYSGTIFAGGTGQSYENNVLINLDNDYEIVARNRSILPRDSDDIDATNNWWGYEFKSSAISGRIRDAHDFDQLLRVVYEPYYITNDTLVDGKCLPGWSGIGGTCFIYVAGVMSNEEAKYYCMSEEGSLPYLTDVNEKEIKKLIIKKQSNFNYYQRVWVLSLDRPADCSSYSVDGLEFTHCAERLPFLCEKDPDIRLAPLLDTLTIATLSSVGAAILLVLLCVLFWICKSRRRQKERLERRNSIRASKRSLRSISNMSLQSENSSCRRIINEGREKPVKMIEVAAFKGSFDSIEKAPSKFDSSSYFNSSIEDNQSYEICEAANHKVEYSDFEDRFENESRPDITHSSNGVSHPSYQFGYDNKAFMDNTYPGELEQQPPWCSSSNGTTESTADIKRYLETSLDTNGRDETTSRSTPSTFSQEMPSRKQLLETDM